MSISTKTAAPRKSAMVEMMIRKAGVFLIALILGAALQIAPAKAIGIDLTKLPKVKEYEPLPKEKLEKDSKRVNEAAPYNETKMAYELRLPKNWTNNIQTPPVNSDAQKPILSDTVLGILGRYIGAPKNLLRSYVVVEGQGMNYEISTAHWFVNFILLNGFSLTALTEKSPTEIEAMYVQVDKDQTYIVRARVMVNGNRLIMVRYYLPQENYEEEKAQQGQVIQTFKLLNPTGERIEKQNTYGFLDQSYFSYPVSWNLKEKSILSIERMSAILYQERLDGKESILEGHLKINVVSRLLKTTLAQEVDTFRKGLKIKDYKIGQLIENVKYNYDPSIKHGKAQSYRLDPLDAVNMQPYEILVTVMQGDDYYYITSLISPSREHDFYGWARNMEAARIINESIRRSNMPKFDPNDPYYDYLKE